jgi:hypothetical protein
LHSLEYVSKSHDLTIERIE